jgi:hypothetical protein
MRDSVVLSAALRRIENQLIKLEESVELVLSKLEELLVRPPSVTLMFADDPEDGSETTQVAEADEDFAEYQMLGGQGN